MKIEIVGRIVLVALLRNKGRSILTSLGIVVGIAAVIAVNSIGLGASRMMEKEIMTMGKNLVMVIPDRNRRGVVHTGMGSSDGLTVFDCVALKNELPHLIGGVSPTVNVGCQLVRMNKNWFLKLSGVSEDYPEIRNWSLSEGRFFDDIEVENGSRVCVIGKTARDKLFDEGENCVGETIRVDKIPFRIVGVLGSKGANGWGQDQDDTVLAPFTTVGRVLAKSKVFSVSMINVSLHSMDDLEEANREIKALLRQRHKLPDDMDDDFELRDTTEIMNTAGAVTRLITLMLTIIAAISLFVGGVGIMNIMLVSVTERIKEIGLRMAIGATPLNILVQFLLESLVLSVVGGTIGVLFGIGLAYCVGCAKHWPVAVEIRSVLVAFLFATGVGVFFGFYPAYKASKMRPIASLRYE